MTLHWPRPDIVPSSTRIAADIRPFDMAHQELTNSLTKRKTPTRICIDVESKTMYDKLMFPGRLRVPKQSETLVTLRNGFDDDSWVKTGYPANAYVNFENDVFVIQNLAGYATNPLQFLFIPIHRKKTKASKTIRWANRIQHVAVYPPRGQDIWFVHLHSEFMASLSPFKNLKTLYLVTRLERDTCILPAASVWDATYHNQAGFSTCSDFDRRHLTSPRRHQADFCHCNLWSPRTAAHAVGRHQRLLSFRSRSVEKFQI